MTPVDSSIPLGPDEPPRSVSRALIDRLTRTKAIVAMAIGLLGAGASGAAYMGRFATRAEAATVNAEHARRLADLEARLRAVEAVLDYLVRTVYVTGRSVGAPVEPPPPPRQ